MSLEELAVTGTQPPVMTRTSAALLSILKRMLGDAAGQARARILMRGARACVRRRQLCGAAQGATVSLNDLLRRNRFGNRTEAARCFTALLVLASVDKVAPTQEEPYGDIEIAVGVAWGEEAEPLHM